MPNLIKGIVRVKVKGGGQRAQPKDVAKSQPNFYDMPPIDDEAKKHAPKEAANASDKPAKTKKAKLKTKKKVSQ